MKLQLTLRAYRDDVRDQLIEGIKRRVNGLAQSHRPRPRLVSIVETTPPRSTLRAWWPAWCLSLIETLGASNVKEVEPVMGAEDFGLYGRDGVPTFMFRLGTIPPKRMDEAKAKGETLPSLHSAAYHPDPAREPRDRHPYHDRRRPRTDAGQALKFGPWR